MARKLPPLTALRAFEAAARHLSFARAGEELHVTPAAISHQVKALEAHLGVALFRRLARGLALTEAGRAYLPALSDGFDRLAGAAGVLDAGRLAGPLSVSVMPSFASRWLVPRLAGFRRRHPEIDVVLRAESRVVDLAREPVDLAIRHGDGRYPGLSVDLLMTEEVFPVCSPALLAGEHPLRGMDDLRHHVLLHDAEAHEAEPVITWRHWLREAGLDDIDPTRGPGFTDMAMLLQAAAMGAGVALGRTPLVEDDLRAGRLVRPFALSRPANFAYWVVATPAASAGSRAAAFRAWLLAAAQAPGPD